MKHLYKTFEFRHSYLSIELPSRSWFDLFPRVTIHTEPLSRFVVFGWLFFRIQLDLKWTKKQEMNYNGD